MIVVHHLNQSRSLRVLWLLEELGLPYELVHHTRDPVTFLAPPSLRNVHPLGKAPVVVDEDLVLAESGAILETLLQRHGQGRLQPNAEAQEVAYRYWIHAAEGSFMPPLVMSLVLAKMAQAPVSWPARLIALPVLKKGAEGVLARLLRPQMQAQFSLMAETLHKQPWFAGEDFTAADIQMSYPVMAAQARAGLNAPPVLDWLTRVRARPAFQAAQAKVSSE